MDLMRLKYIESISHMKSPPTSASIFGSPLHSSSHHTGFPIIAVAIIGILATGILLVSYYIFVIKCCLNWHRIDLLRRFSFSRNRRVEDPLMVYSPGLENRGLDESVIRSIPVFKYKKREEKDGGLAQNTTTTCECAVCLNEFQENEKLRVIPNCAHIFHIDCIDVWLQNNANCPLCRNSISSTITNLFPLDPIIDPSSTPQDPNLDNFRDEDYVVIEISNTNQIPTNPSLVRNQERLNSRRKGKKFSHVTSMGDECINIRNKDDEFAIQPIRRSFSMDSATDRQLYVAVQEIIQQQRQVIDVSSSEGSSSRVKRSFFSFGHGKGSKNAVLPIHLEL
ncbi:PREDICTED: RING-H2 finger protein ATL16-like [Nicotiana attenuata]|uniref:RING-type E3 ubiquitin transferase n=1 Tax=Nicotiana attenuata TaxID=49451 RepID=A0A1J6JSI6_NICAT|nr:PREDICTED: RING-H2 finger protein ATL16-like [Nicotiana attenuata]OIT20706.1 ring-h2 finger protein atl1 [Nicotiana attenuata]